MDLDALNTAVDAAVAERAFTGVLTIDVGPERVLTRCHGWAHRALQVPNRPETRFATASGTKGFTALAVMRLVEEGVLRLDTPVREFLGEDLPLIDDAVTIEHLLGHTSGIGDYLDEENLGDIADYVLPLGVHALAQTEAFVSVVDGFPQVSPPGERFAYNNGGYIVLAIVVERAARRPFHDLVEEEVFARAGMTASGFLRSDALPGDAALGYLEDAGDWNNVLHLPVRGNGDGGAYTTAADLHRFWCALTAGAIVTGDTVRLMTTPRHDVESEQLRYGLGFWLHRTGPAVLLEGYDAGVSFRSTHDPGTATTVSVLGNSSAGAWPVAGAVAPLFDEPLG